MAGSPDGIGTLENEKFLLEYTVSHSLFGVKNNAVNAQVLCNRDDGISLSKKPNHFYQIQGLPHIFQLSYCKLVVAGHTDFVFVGVNRDVFLRNTMFEQLRREFDFYANLPKIPIVHINLFFIKM